MFLAVKNIMMTISLPSLSRLPDRMKSQMSVYSFRYNQMFRPNRFGDAFFFILFHSHNAHPKFIVLVLRLPLEPFPL